MKSMASFSSLPPEIIRQIIEQILPTPVPRILPRSHSVIKPLLSLTRVARITHLDAIRLLYTYCIKVDNEDNLHRLSISLSHMGGRKPSHLCDTPLTNLGKEGLVMPRLTAEELEVIRWIPETQRLSSLPDISPHRYITAISIVLPLLAAVGVRKMAAIVHSIFNLISLVNTTLRHMILDCDLYMLDSSAFLDKLYKYELLRIPAPSFTMLGSGLTSVFQSLNLLETLFARINTLHWIWFDSRYQDLTPLLWPNLSYCVIKRGISQSCNLCSTFQFFSALEMVVVVRPLGVLSGDERDTWRAHHPHKTLTVVVTGLQSSFQAASSSNGWVSGDGIEVKEFPLPNSLVRGDNWVREQFANGTLPNDWKIISSGAETPQSSA